MEPDRDLDQGIVKLLGDKVVCNVLGYISETFRAQRALRNGDIILRSNPEYHRLSDHDF